MQDIQQPTILIVDDNEDILFHLKLLLENNEYDVHTAKNGKKALKILSQFNKTPDLIISDIMMPVMDGYDFFEAVSDNPRWNRIPFLFLTAKSTPEDIRLGKLLGVDDYITKPFQKEDLIASISGKITRYKKSKIIDEEVNQLLKSLKIKKDSSKFKDNFLYLLVVYWDDVKGPTVAKHYPFDKSMPFSLDTVAKQLFNAATSIYGQDKITKAQSILLDIENINNKGYLFFDSYPDEKERYGEKQYMLTVITPSLSYFNSLKIRNVLKKISEKIKMKQEWDVKEYWEKILQLLSSNPIILHS
jgi:CheY-like chemotaxis protein